MTAEQVYATKEKLIQELEEVAAIIIDINSNLDDLTSMVQEDGTLAETLSHMNSSLNQLTAAFNKVPLLKEIMDPQIENRET